MCLRLGMRGRCGEYSVRMAFFQWRDEVEWLGQGELRAGLCCWGGRILLTHLCDLLPTSLEWALTCDLSSDQFGVSQAQGKRNADHGIRGKMRGAAPR